MIKEHNVLRGFFGGYFHQDWDLDGATWQEVLHKYFELSPEANELQEVAYGLRDLLRMFPADADLWTYLERELLCQYRPAPTRTREWIDTLAGAFERELRRRRRRGVTETWRFVAQQLSRSTSRDNAMRSLFGGYFHQDWQFEGETWAEVVQAYIRAQSSADKLRQVATELRELATRFRSDQELLDYLNRELACDYLPEEPARVWVMKIADVIEEHLRS